MCYYPSLLFLHNDSSSSPKLNPSTFCFLSSVFVFNMQPYLLTLFPYVFVECKLHFGPQISHGINAKTQNMSICRPFFRAVKLFKCLLRVVLSVLCSSWEPPRLKNYSLPETNHIFCNYCFSVLWGSWRPYWVNLGASWPTLAPKWFTKCTQTKTRKSKQIRNKWSFVNYTLNRGLNHFGVHFGPHKSAGKNAVPQKICFPTAKIHLSQKYKDAKMHVTRLFIVFWTPLLLIFGPIVVFKWIPRLSRQI